MCLLLYYFLKLYSHSVLSSSDDAPFALHIFSEGGWSAIYGSISAGDTDTIKERAVRVVSVTLNLDTAGSRFGGLNQT